MGLIGAGIGGEVDVPLPAEEVQLWGPDFVGVRARCRGTPNDLFLGMPELRKAPRLPDCQVFSGCVHVVVIAVFGNNPGIRTGGKQRVRKCRRRGRSGWGSRGTWLAPAEHRCPCSEPEYQQRSSPGHSKPRLLAAS